MTRKRSKYPEEVFKIVTTAAMNEEARLVWIYSQKVYYENSLVLNLPYRTFNLFKLFTASQLEIINRENLNSVLSQKLLVDLVRDPTIKKTILESCRE